MAATEDDGTAESTVRHDEDIPRLLNELQRLSALSTLCKSKRSCTSSAETPVVATNASGEGDVEVVGLQKATQHNGKRGKVVGYNSEIERFSVDVGGQELLSIRAANILLCPSVTNWESRVRRPPYNRKGKQHAPSVSRAWAHLQPGACFVGTICIPGVAGRVQDHEDSTVPYELVVWEEFDDELGEPITTGLHGAHEDSQIVCFKVEESSEDSHVKLSYRDFETLCSGTMMLEDGSITGSVNQLVHGEDGFSYPSTESIHTFSLKPDPSVPPGLHYDLRCTRRMLIRAISLFSGKEIPPPLLTLGHTACMDLIQEVQNFGEDMCCNLRRQKELLDGLVFESPEQKTELMEQLAEGPDLSSLENFRTPLGISLERGHASHDRPIAVLVALHHIFRPSRWNGGSDDEQEELDLFQRALDATRSRLFWNFMPFEQSFKSARQRVTSASLRQWQRSVDTAGETCAICILDLEIGQQGVYLTCGHSFHDECCLEWLKMRSSCPNCRHDLSKED